METHTVIGKVTQENTKERLTKGKDGDEILTSEAHDGRDAPRYHRRRRWCTMRKRSIHKERSTMSGH
ncbi:hydantoinase [Sesbania bispinosa]|nr:hydantoinase [Sesbania bispinosa]